MVVERVFEWMEARGYPKEGTEWLRRRRLVVILVLAVLSWVALVVLGVAAWGLLSLVFGLS